MMNVTCLHSEGITMECLTECFFIFTILNLKLRGGYKQNLGRPGSSLQCRHILGGQKLLVYVCTFITAFFVMMEED